MLSYGCSMRLLITGASGLLGSALVPGLRDRGHAVVPCARSSGDIVADLSDRAAAAAAVERSRPDVVVNLAAKTNVDHCERDPQAAYLANVRVVEQLAAAL